MCFVSGRGAGRGGGRGRMRGFGRRGRGGRGGASSRPTKDELDAQLDAYNAKVRLGLGFSLGRCYTGPFFHGHSAFGRAP